MPYFFELLAVALGGLVGCYGLGTALLQLAGWPAEEPFFTIFFRLLTGLLVATTAYAVIRTGGVSILLPIPLLLGIVIIALRQPIATLAGAEARSGLRPALLLALGISLFVFAGQYGLVYEPGAAHLQTPFQDYVYYSRLTLMLNQVGLETNSLEMVFPQFQTEQPYHYLEMWLNALLVWGTGLPSVWVFFVSVATILIATAGVGFAAVYSYCGLRPAWAALLGLLTLTVTGTVWSVLAARYGMVANGSLLAHLTLQLNPKLAPVYIAELLAVLLLLRQRWLAAAAAVAMLPLLFVATAPAALAGIVGLICYLGSSQLIPWRKALVLLIPMLGMLAYLGLFYALQPPAYQFVNSSQSSALAAVTPAPGEAKTLLNIAAGVVVNYGIYYAAYVALLLLLWFRPGVTTRLLPADRPLLAWGAAMLTGAILMRTLGNHFLDGFQFFSNAIIPLSAAVVAVLLGRALHRASTTWYVIAVATICGLLLVTFSTDKTDNTRYSTQFLQQIGPILSALPDRGGYLLGDADYKNAYMTSSDSYTAGTYVSNFKNDYLLISLSALVPDSLRTDARFARDSSQAELIRRRATLVRLAKLRQLAGRPINADSVELTLVRQAGLAFICASRRAKLPAALRPLVRASYRDARSGEILYVLRPTLPGPAL